MKKIAVIYSKYSPVIDAIKYTLSDCSVDCLSDTDSTEFYDLVICLDNKKFNKNAIACHHSLLPAFDCDEPEKEAILSGAKVTGITIYNVDTKKIRGRFNKDEELNVSYVAEKKNYDKYLKHINEEEENFKNRRIKRFVKKETQLNVENLKENPLKEIMHGFHEKMINDNYQEMNKKIERELKKEKEEKQQKLKKVNIEIIETNDKNFEFINSDANLLGPKKSSERVNLNSNTNLPKEKELKNISDSSKNNDSNNKDINKNKLRKSDSNITKLNYFKKIKEKEILKE